MPAELRENMNLAAMEDFDIDAALRVITSPEFQKLLNQEYNYAYFNMRIDSSSAKELVKELDSYIQNLGDSNQFYQWTLALSACGRYRHFVSLKITPGVWPLSNHKAAFRQAQISATPIAAVGQKPTFPSVKKEAAAVDNTQHFAHDFGITFIGDKGRITEMLRTPWYWINICRHLWIICRSFA